MQRKNHRSCRLRIYWESLGQQTGSPSGDDFGSADASMPLDDRLTDALRELSQICRDSTELGRCVNLSPRSPGAPLKA